MKKQISYKELPCHKIIKNTNFVVDCFKFNIIDANVYFLSHFHADHYDGLNKSFNSILYCSKTTANLVMKQCRVNRQNIQILEMHQWYEIERDKFVLLVEANHCPGAVCFIFKIKDTFILHTGDFRCADQFYLQDFSIINCTPIKIYNEECMFKKLKFNNRLLEKIDDYISDIKLNYENTLQKVPSCLPSNILDIQYSEIYLDNTFENFRVFNSQKDIIHKIFGIVDKKIHGYNCLVPFNYYFLFATYSVGKEKIFLSIAEYLDCEVHVNKYKFELFKCFDDYCKNRIDREVKNIVQTYNKKTIIGSPFKRKLQVNLKNYKNVFDRITDQENKYQIGLISKLHINKNKINELVKNIKADRICIFVGTGWQDKTTYYDWIRENGRIIKRGIEIIYLPYSEHSSSLELENFKKNMNFEKIKNTVKFKH